MIHDSRNRSRLSLLATLALSGVILAGCGATQPTGPEDPGSPGVTPAQQCQLLQTGMRTAELGVLLADVKDETASIAIDAGLEAVRVAAADYCDAVAMGRETDALETFLKGFNAALDTLNARLREARAVASAGLLDAWKSISALTVESAETLATNGQPGKGQRMVTAVTAMLDAGVAESLASQPERRASPTKPPRL